MPTRATVRLPIRRALAGFLGAVIVIATGITPAAAAAPALAPLTTGSAGKVIPGAYIVTLRSNADAASLARSHSLNATKVYTSAMRGFAARLTGPQLALLRADPNVAAVEADQVFHTAVVSQATASGGWGLDRLDQRALPLNNTYTYTGKAANVYAYVIDTGLQLTQPEFRGRVSKTYDAFGGTGDDCNGHGTHVGGLIGGTTYGVAKAVRLRAVRVLDCDGSGTTSGVIAGIDYVRAHAAKPSVANLSLTGPKSTALNNAVTALVNSGVPVAVAAGNDGASACASSPGSATGVIAVAASDITDRHASFSNYGSCVELYAPGVSIRSSYLGGTSAALSGTSMASPLVAGVLALRISTVGTTPDKARDWVMAAATTGVITSRPTGSPDRLLFKSTL